MGILSHRVIEFLKEGGFKTSLAGGLPLSYIIWFPLGFAHKPFWQGFLLLFRAGWVTILTVTSLTPAERTETLDQFYRICRPPGF
jgi:hypothetical protein